MLKTFKFHNSTFGGVSFYTSEIQRCTIAICDQYCINKALTDQHLLSFWLNDREQETLNHFPRKKRSINWLGGQIATKYACLHNQAEQSPLRFSVEYAESGKPRLAGFSKTHISISHCHQYMAGIASQRPIGIDIENHAFTLGNHITNVIFGYEINKFRQCISSDKDQALNVLWSFKEALFKIYGEGHFFEFANSVQLLDICHFDYGGLLVVCNVKGKSSCYKMQLNYIDDYRIIFVEPAGVPEKKRLGRHNENVENTYAEI